ncbi:MULTISPECIES: hypothetical protein [unclassified Meiothermus]|uniref:hypothetical protein n=1 Tax=unclassified Meiothermus TaxID=370471 RepID=UPI000D7BE68E|nr:MULTISPECIES: hypothetical protein [unclassified Meiothermus]PZA05749.1 hypothetical protein DNA98_17190 [Meiothermus sp. Pnk-1]RYM33189.1 hypothetical protein EWH23_13660 [Meiothermus sp. PNK-Is4]
MIEPLKDLTFGEPPETPEVEEPTPALARLLLEASPVELHLLYKAMSHFLAEGDYDLDELAQATTLHRMIGREVERRLRQAAWPAGEETELPF